ncbi:MAG: hypothetical protein C0423_20735 [Methylibium sp.]|nr:hypothetical protein [Methylibium sp.]
MKRRAVLLAASALGLAALAGPAEDELLIAAQRDDGKRVMVLMLRGADPNARNAKRQSALHVALSQESERALKSLLEHPGLDVNAINQAGETPLMLAALKGRVDWAESLVARGALVNEPGWNALHYAASGPSPDLVSWLLGKGAEIDALSPNGTTALMMAAGYGPLSSVERLLKAGADPTRRNQQGLSAADFARRAGHDRLAQQLDGSRR